MSDESKRKTIDDLLGDSMISVGATGSDAYTITLDTNSFNYTSDTITIDSGSSQSVWLTNTNMGAAQPVYTIGTSTGSGFTSSFNWGNPVEWVDSFPEWQRVQDMCSKYPGLEIALRNFRTVYTLVKDDYDNPKDEE